MTDDQAVSVEDRMRAQRHLIALADERDARDLRVCARRIFEVLAPEGADRREGEALEREERRARERCRLAMRDNGDGTTSGSFVLPTAQAEMLSKALQALAAPRRWPGSARQADGRPMPYARSLGLAFCDLVEHLPASGLPQAGGVSATVVVTLDLAALRSGLGAASLDTGSRLSAGEARRLACGSGLVPVVHGGASQPLDLGRTRRLFSSAQRTALAVRDQGCTADGCDRPPAWCEAHHDRASWAEGGTTDLTDGRLLCPHHHRLAHDGGYDMRRLPGGAVRFHRRR